MASGSFSGRPACTLYIDVSEASTSISGNTSVVNWNAYVVGNSASWNYSSGSWSATVNGVGVGSGGWTYDFRSNNTVGLGSGSITITHNADGSKSFSYSATATDAGGSPLGTANASGTGTLTDFVFTAGVPGSLTAVNSPGVGVILTWTASTSYKTPVNYWASYRSSSDGGSTWSAWSSAVDTGTDLTHTYTGLTPGLTYQFRLYATNGYDGNSAYATSSNLFLTAGGKRYATNNWVLTATQAKIYKSGAWTSLGTAKRLDGATKTWINLS